MLNVAIDVQSRFATHHVLRLRENILDECARHDTQCDFAINSAECQVVDRVAKRWNIGSLRRIDIDSQYIFSVEVDVRRQIEGKRRVAAFVLTELFAVYPDRRSRHYTFKIDEHALSLGLRRQLESPPINRDELVVLVVEAVPGKSNVAVRNHNAIERRVIEILAMCSLRVLFAVSPVT